MMHATRKDNCSGVFLQNFRSERNEKYGRYFHVPCLRAKEGRREACFKNFADSEPRPDRSEVLPPRC